MPRCLLEFPDWRVVDTEIDGVGAILEVRDGADGLGVERWRTFKLNNKTERDLFGYILRILQKESHAHQ